MSHFQQRKKPEYYFWQLKLWTIVLPRDVYWLILWPEGKPLVLPTTFRCCRNCDIHFAASILLKASVSRDILQHDSAHPPTVWMTGTTEHCVWLSSSPPSSKQSRPGSLSGCHRFGPWKFTWKVITMRMVQQSIELCVCSYRMPKWTSSAATCFKHILCQQECVGHNGDFVEK
jgi:hypothetical protein